MSAPANADVNGKKGRLFRDTEPPVYILDDGRFAMKFGGLWRVKSSIAPLLKLIGRFQAVVKIMRLGEVGERDLISDIGIDFMEAVSFENQTIGTKDGKRQRVRWQRWYEYDPKVDAGVKALNREIAAANKAYRKVQADIIKKQKLLLKNLTEVTERNFRVFVDKQDQLRQRSGGNDAEA